MPLIFQKGTTSQRSQTLVVGSGLNLDQTPDGLSQISAGGPTSGEVVIQPSGGDDTSAIQAAVWPNARITLAPGTFSVRGIIDLAAGVSVRGSGTDKTTVVKTDFNGPVFRLGDQVQFAAIENLRIVGPGIGVGVGNKGIQAARSQNGLPIARRLSFRNLYIKDLIDYGMHLNNCAQVEVDNVIFENIANNPMHYQGSVSGAGEARIATVRAFNCSAPIYLNGVGAVALIACEAESCSGSFRLNNTFNCSLLACASRKCATDPALWIGGSSYTVVDSFLSDNTGGPADPLHLLVDTNSHGVQINGFAIGNSGTPTWEADVTTASGPVLVGSHNFTAGRIASSNKFGDLSYTLRA